MRFALLAVLLAGTSAVSYPQAPSAAVGTVTGRVIEAHSDNPSAIQKALVILKRGQEPGIGAYSDDKGNYTLEVPPGAYIVTVERSGYVPAQPSRTRTVTVQANQTTEAVNLELVHTAAISGRILDADGEPIPQVNVQLNNATKKNERSFRGAVTDDRGAFRIFQIPPGKYRLSAVYQATLEGKEIKLQAPNGQTEENYVTTYFPGTTNMAQAATIDVPSGADMTGFDIQLQRVRAVHVRGHVSGMGATPLPFAMVALQSADALFGGAHTTVVRNRSGDFELSGVQPGKYILSANAPDFTNRGNGPSAQRIIEVEQVDLEGIELTLVAPQTISGLVVLPEGRQIPPGLLVTLSNRERTNRQGGGFGPVGPDGAFTLASVAAGDYNVELGITSPGGEDDLYVGAIRRGDEDVLAKGLSINGPSSGPIQIILKPNGGAVEIFLHTTNGDPLPENNVFLLPDPPRREQPSLYGMCITDARGGCKIQGMAPGNYHMLAAPKEAAIDVRDPDSRKDLEKHAKPVKVTEGDRQRVELEMAPDDW